MTTITAEPFALTLFTWIRNNKKALYASEMPLDVALTPTACHYAQAKRYRFLKNQFARFETRYRGAQKMLAGAGASTVFTEDARRYAYSLVHSAGGSQAFLQDTPNENFNAMWASFFTLQGLRGAQADEQSSLGYRLERIFTVYPG